MIHHDDWFKFYFIYNIILLLLIHRGTNISSSYIIIYNIYLYESIKWVPVSSHVAVVKGNGRVYIYYIQIGIYLLLLLLLFSLFFGRTHTLTLVYICIGVPRTRNPQANRRGWLKAGVALVYFYIYCRYRRVKNRTFHPHSHPLAGAVRLPRTVVTPLTQLRVYDSHTHIHYILLLLFIIIISTFPAYTYGYKETHIIYTSIDITAAREQLQYMAL